MEVIIANGNNDSTTNKYYAKVATWTEVTNTITTDDPEQETLNESVYNMTTTNVNYQDLTKSFIMPFDYLWSLLVITEDKDFVLEIADLVYNSKIEITVHDNLTVNTNVNVYTYTKKERTETSAKVSVNYNDISGLTYRHSDSASGDWTDEKENPYTTTYTTITKTNTLDTMVTLADVWMAKYTKTYEYTLPEKVESNSTSNLENIDYPSEPNKTTNNDTYGHANALLYEKKKQYEKYNPTGKIDFVNEKIYSATVNIVHNYTNTTEVQKYTSSPIEVKEKVDKYSEEPNFVNILIKDTNKKAMDNLLDVPDWLFEILENKETISDDLIDLTKYLLYKATGTNYGVTEYDFSALYKSDLTTVGAGDYIVDTTKSSEDMVIKDLETLKNAFSGYPGSAKLIEHAQEFLDLQEKYNVNAIFAAAVSISETSAGRAGHAIDGKNNWFNIECRCGNSAHGRFEKYSTAKESIEKFYWQIAKGSYYFTEGNYTVSDIGMIYCEDADAPGGWIEHTNAFMTQMFQAAGIDITTYAGEGVQYYQGDYANVSYGSSNIAKCGCGPTCFAMVASQITGKEITPADAVAWCGNKYYVSGAGTSWSYFANATSHFNLGVTVKQTTSISEAVSALKKGKLVISSQSQGLFTSGGHFILLYKVDENDNIYVKDPNKNNAVNKGYNDRAFTQNEINQAARQYFIF